MINFNKKFKIKELIIYETKHWVWSLRPEQTTIGSSIISLKRECYKLSDVTKEEFADYQKMVKIIEGSLKIAFNFSKINYLMLMMNDKHIHYHVIPRYNEDVLYDNKLWFDFGWPGLPELSKSNEVIEKNTGLLKHIRDSSELYIKENIKIGYTTGVFDLFHVGHLNILKKAKEQCDYLIVGVTTDELVSYKNKKAVINLEDRMEIVSGIKYVDKVVVQENMNKMEAWEKFKFNVMFVGSDWQGTKKWNNFEKEFAKVGVKIIYVPYTQKVSSTKLREKLGVSNEK